MPSDLPDRIRWQLEQTDFQIYERSSVPEITSLLNSVTLEGGKRFRPALCYWMAGILGQDMPAMLLYAQVAEWVHNASLAHDDVIDEASTRRDRPTLNAVASNKQAVLSGDLLLARVMVKLSDSAPRPIIRELAEAIESLVQGEWLQMEATGVVDIDAGRLQHACALKTGSLIRWCCRVPALSAKLSAEVLERCGKLGDAIGLAFQMVDDVVDFEATSGKEFAKDLRAGLVNWVSLELLAIDPTLKAQVATILNTGKMNAEPPWQEATLARAKSRVRARSDAQLERACSLIDEIQNLTSPVSEEARELGKQFQSALRKMGERTR